MKNKIPVFDIKLKETEKKYINDCLDTSFIGQGSYVKKLEDWQVKCLRLIENKRDVIV